MRGKSDETLRILERASALLDPVRPMTLRHLYYLLVSEGVLENAQSEYNKLKRITAIGRRELGQTQRVAMGPTRTRKTVSIPSR